MAKTKHNNLLDTVDSIFTDAKNRGVMHLYMDDEEFDGRHIHLEGNQLKYFGTTSYMGFDQDDRLKSAAIKAILKYGTQFPLSKAYMSQALNRELEELLEQMYGHPVVVGKNSTLIHLGVIPSIIRDEDAVILDHQVHHSVQNACNLLKVRGIPIEIVRHNRLDLLEERIKELRSKHTKIWFMIDGIYSMYGDAAPLKDIIKLMDQYPQLNLYIDDVHGMSWAGKNGTGFALSEIGTLHPKMVLVSTLGKSFGASGAFMVSSNHELVRFVKTFGSSLSFSAQLEPSSLAAAIASAKIHLSDEIIFLQSELAGKIQYCNDLINATNLPLYVTNSSPLFYIGTGLPASGFNLSKRLIKDGFYTNVGIYPAVPVKNTGIRFSISRHNEKADIKALVEALDYHFPKMLEEENHSHNDIRKAFKMPLLNQTDSSVVNETLTLSKYTSIVEIEADVWNTYMGKDGAYDHAGLTIIENAFKGNSDPNENWDFHYYVIRDQADNVILMTFFIEGNYKEDMLSQGSKSEQIELLRKKNPSFLVSRALCMGTFLTEGKHLFIDKSTEAWKVAFKLLFKNLEMIQEKNNIETLLLRDFESNQIEENELFTATGFVKIQMPDSCVIDHLSQWSSPDDLLKTLNKNNRDHLKADVLKFENNFRVEIKNTLSDTELNFFYDLYLNVKNKNFDINTFTYPRKLIKEMCGRADCEFIILHNNNSNEDQLHNVVSVIFCYRNHSGDYIPLFIGMNYEELSTLNVYKQSLYKIVLRAKELQCSKIFMGFSATIEKRKFGAIAVSKMAYIQNKDNYAVEYIETIPVK